VPPFSDFTDAPASDRASRLADLLAAPAHSPSLPYVHALLGIVGATGLAFLLFPLVDLANVVMVYLLAVVLIAAKLGGGPSVFATVVGVASFVYFFVPHYYSFVLEDLRYLPTFLIMLFVGLVVASLTSQLRSQALTTQRRERRSQALYLLSRGLAAAERRSELAEVVREHVGGMFAGGCELLEYTPTGLMVCGEPNGRSSLSPADLARATAALADRTTCDVGAATMLPMVVANEPVGVLCCRTAAWEQPPATANLRFLEALANNVGTALHRLVVADRARATQQHADQERMRNVMLSSMSHDFRTPLAAITGAVSTVIDDDTRLDPATRLDLLHAVRENADQMERQIRNLLDLTRLEGGNLQIRRELHPLDEVVGGAMTRVERLLEGRRVDVEVSPNLPLVGIDALLVEQLLVNLLENAVRYTPPGSEIAVTAREVAHGVQIEVADRGPGVPRSEHELVFEKFHRLPGGARSAGAGLGLAICKAIAQLHGGRIHVEDRSGGGARFVVELPLANADRHGIAPSNSGSPS
jgi:two-component system sensor histidine kinase KdpD